MNDYQSKKNLTRFTYENSAFQGWRLCVSRKGKQFVRYFSDKQYGSPEAALKAAEVALEQLRETLSKAKLINGTHSDATIKKISKILAKPTKKK